MYAIQGDSTVSMSLLEDAGAQPEEYPRPSMSDPSTGLDNAQVESRRSIFGLNEVEEKNESTIWSFLGYFCGPMEILIWAAIFLVFLTEEWIDFVVLMILQLLNGCLSYWLEKDTSDALAALKNRLALHCTVRRDGIWQEIESRNLVPGDLINLKLGAIVPADCVLLEGSPLEVDQAALTGEYLPVTTFPGEPVKMGATIKHGECLAHVTETGLRTFFGQAACNMSSIENTGRFQLVLYKISMSLLGLCILGVVIILFDLLSRGVPVIRSFTTCIVLLVVSVPMAMQVVSTSTLAMGARKLADNSVVVVALSVIEKMAGIEVLCSNKTGTLTLDRLKLYEPMVISDITAEELNFYAALASNRIESDQDAIDSCIVDAVKMSPMYKTITNYVELDFRPFDPISKRTEATVRDINGNVFKVMKGAPQVLLSLCNPRTEIETKVSQSVQELADRGFRSLGVARTDQNNNYEFLGLLSLFDPLQEDTKETIALAQQMGIDVKMITGDQMAIAKETCRNLGMGTNILGTEVLDETQRRGGIAALNEIVRNAHGFAEILPEHKLQVVQILLDQGIQTGMTGDGVNDAPALRRAHIGIAVADATDAARAASDIILTKQGLKGIIGALLQARKIFCRIRNFCIYRISATFHLISFFFVSALAFHVADYFPNKQRNVGSESTLFGPEDGNSSETVFTLPVIALVLITLFNYGTTFTICRDNVAPASKPQRWHLDNIFMLSTGMGLWLLIENVFMLLMGLNAGPGGDAGDHCGQRPSDFHHDPNANTNKCDGFYANVFGDETYGTFSYKQLKSLIYLTLSISGFLTAYSVRTTGPFFSLLPSYGLMTTSLGSMFITTLFACVAGSASQSLDMEGLSGKTAAFAWFYCLVFFVIQDLVIKRMIYAALAKLHQSKVNDNMIKIESASISNRLESEVRKLRSTIGGSRHAPSTTNIGDKSFLTAPRHSILRPSVVSDTSGRLAQFETRLDQLEHTVMDMRRQVEGFGRLSLPASQGDVSANVPVNSPRMSTNSRRR